jgi:SAM-dependent methyltransferase
MQFEKIRLAGRRLILGLVPPYRSIVTRFASPTKQIGRVGQSQTTVFSAQEPVPISARQISTIAAEPDHEIQRPADPGESEENKIRIAITRDNQEWTIAPDIFETFSFQEGDLLRVLLTDTAAQLPNSWGDTHIQIQPGQAIRVPSVYKFFQYKGFDVPVHLISLIGAGLETFEGVAQSHLSNVRKHVGIAPDMRILDIGSGIGSVAFQLLDVLGPRGEYIGIDVARDSIIWCCNNISKRYKNFHFFHFDAANELYNPYGMKISGDFTLPVEDSSVDRIILFSVFTHLLEEEVLHYKREFRRALMPDGLAYASFFRLTPEALEAAKTKRNTEWEPKFDIPLGNGVFANDPVFPRGAVGFTDTAARRLISQAGLRLDKPFLKGW